MTSRVGDLGVVDYSSWCSKIKRSFPWKKEKKVHACVEEVLKRCINEGMSEGIVVGSAFGHISDVFKERTRGAIKELKKRRLQSSLSLSVIGFGVYISCTGGWGLVGSIGPMIGGNIMLIPSLYQLKQACVLKYNQLIVKKCYEKAIQNESKEP